MNITIACEYALHQGERMKILGMSYEGDEFTLKDSEGEIHTCTYTDLKPIFGGYVLNLAEETASLAISHDNIYGS